MNREQLTELRKAAEEATKGEWEIDWYECRADREDVKARTAKKVSEVLWRVPRSIGPVSADENHWARLHLDVSEEDARHIATANPETILSLLDYVESLERDAARYRYLRDEGEGFDISVLERDTEDGEVWVHGYPPEELDDAIDAAMGESK